jgi:ATP-dependent RNA helicase SUPV3L1/SUV3
MAGEFHSRIKNVTAVLGPTNTGKTHLAIERMIGHKSGIIGLPLRLLAREVYDKVAARVGAEHVALVTGEEKIKPENARYWVATVEAMPLDLDVEFVAIDEVQLAADADRGHVFTDRILNARGSEETLLLGSQTMRDVIGDLIPGANFVSRPRLSKLTYAGQKKVTRIPARSAVIAFSASEVYALAELIRRQLGGTAVVLGALSPRTRNAQVELYQSGDVDYLVATDAIGMGLNLDVDHVAFSAHRKFDGVKHRELTPSETAQIAGRAGRHLNDGTFGVTGSCEPFDDELVQRLESHEFEPVRVLQWRNRDLDYSSLKALAASLRTAPSHGRLARARSAEDVLAFETLCEDAEVTATVASSDDVARLWDVCQVPDYRKISAHNHAELVSKLYGYLSSDAAVIPEDWFAKQVAFADRTDGDIDTLSTRLAHIRTWTYVANRNNWLADAAGWQGRTRDVEDRLSDALHECLTQRFVDQRTSALMRGMRDKTELSAEIADDGAVHVENHFVGRLKGFRFQPEEQGEGVHGRATRNATAQVLSRELAMRVRRVVAAQPAAFKLDLSGQILWRDEPIALLESGEDPLKPLITVLADEHLSAADNERVKESLEAWIKEAIETRLKPLADIAASDELTGMAKGIGFRMYEAFGVLRRDTVADDVKSLEQPARAELRKFGLRFGAFNLFFPLLLKPAASELTSILWVLRHGKDHNLDRFDLPPLPRPGLTSAAVDTRTPADYYRVAGYHVCGPRAVRVDILERLADLIRPLLAWRSKGEAAEAPPEGASGDGGFLSTPQMMSILGCSEEELASVLTALGFVAEKRKKTGRTDDESTSAKQNETLAQDVGKPADPAVTSAGPTETVEQPEPAVTSEADAATTAPETEVLADQQAAKPAAADDTETVWRPARKRGRRPHKHTGPKTDADTAAPADHKGKPRSGRKERTSAKPYKGRKPQPHQGKGPRKSGAVHRASPPKTGKQDTSSPFAALSALRQQLEKPDSKS